MCGLILCETIIIMQSHYSCLFYVVKHDDDNDDDTLCEVEVDVWEELNFSNIIIIKIYILHDSLNILSQFYFIISVSE